MHIQTDTFEIHPVQDDEHPVILEVYRACEDFLALGPVAQASMVMVEADLRLSEKSGGVFCGIYNPAGIMIGVLDVVLSQYEGDPAHAFLELLMIARPYRSQGLGAAVVQAVEAEIRRDPAVQAILAGVQYNNPGAIRFWNRMGYRITGPAVDCGDGTAGYPLRKDL